MIEIFQYERRRKTVMAGGNGSMGRKNIACFRQLMGFIKGKAFTFHERPNPLKREKCRMSFIHMADCRPNIHRVESAKPTDTEEKLLFETHFLVAPVKS